MKSISDNIEGVEKNSSYNTISNYVDALIDSYLIFKASRYDIKRKEYLKSLHVVSDNEKAIWLIDYWCNKDIRGLIQMPFSRHWIMHTEACLRIKNKI